MEFLTYLFWPNPGNATYGSPKVVVLLVVCGALVLLSFGLRLWRRRLHNPVTKRLSRSWASSTFWFGVSGFMLLVSRVEQISYLSMRFLWVVWGVILLLYAFFQVKQFRTRHYEKLPQETVEDPREKYLPKKKR